MFLHFRFYVENVYWILEDQNIIIVEIDIPERTYKVEVSSQVVNNLNIAWHVKRHKNGNQFQNWKWEKQNPNKLN